MGLSRLERLGSLIDPPENEQLYAAFEELSILRAIQLDIMNDELTVSITDHGEKLLGFPIEPTFAK